MSDSDDDLGKMMCLEVDGNDTKAKKRSIKSEPKPLSPP